MAFHGLDHSGSYHRVMMIIVILRSSSFKQPSVFVVPSRGVVTNVIQVEYIVRRACHIQWVLLS